MNNKLLSGPDLTNQLAGGTDLGDTEEIYYQLQVPEEQISVLRFLWWIDSDLGFDLPDHEMCYWILQLCISKDGN